MNLYHLQSSDKVAEFASEWIGREIKCQNAASVFVPAGNTPLKLYQFWEKTRPDYLSQIKLIQIDELVSGPQAGMFKRFFQSALPSYLDNIEWIGEFPKKADIAVLGLGLNGHVAFHEPGIPSDFQFGRVPLCDDTCENLKSPKGSEGLTYGVDSFLKCKKILVMVTGGSKKEILNRFLNGDKSVPAAALLDHPGLEIVCDMDAYQSFAEAC